MKHLQEEHFHWNLNFAIRVIAISLNLNSVHAMIAYIMNFKIKNLLIFQSVNLLILGQVAKLNTVCVLIL